MDTTYMDTTDLDTTDMDITDMDTTDMYTGIDLDIWVDIFYQLAITS